MLGHSDGWAVIDKEQKQEQRRRAEDAIPLTLKLGRVATECDNREWRGKEVIKVSARSQPAERPQLSSQSILELAQYLRRFPRTNAAQHPLNKATSAGRVIPFGATDHISYDNLFLAITTWRAVLHRLASHLFVIIPYLL